MSKNTLHNALTYNHSTYRHHNTSLDTSCDLHLIFFVHFISKSDMNICEHGYHVYSIMGCISDYEKNYYLYLYRK